nr:homeobox protein vent1-like [Nerophis lumbriciformis]
MRGPFSIEWMAKSSRAQELAGTHADSLPGFYGRPASDHKPGSEAESGSGVEEETSGYESERSPSPPGRRHDVIAGRRPRTAFTAEQIGSLERAFERNAYLGTHDKAQLCHKLNLSDKQIRNWFQNRRMKLKRTVQDALAQASRFAPYPPELRAYRAVPYPGLCSPPPSRTAAFPPNGVWYAPPLDSFYQYSAGATPATSPLTGSYSPYPQYY